VGRRRRIEFFFVLFLVAILAFAVLTRQRNAADNELVHRTEHIFETLFAPAPIDLESDTLYWYVSQADSSGRFRAPDSPFITSLTLPDIGPEDAVRMTLTALLRNNVLISPQCVRILGRRAVGDLADRTVMFPVQCSFTHTGVYALRFTASAHRVHAAHPGYYSYRGTMFPDTLIPRGMLDRAETVSRTLNIVVEDTSVDTPLPVEPLEVSFTRRSIRTAIGFEEENPIALTQAFLEPRVRLIKGSGRIERRNIDAATPVYMWRGTATKRVDSIVVESRVQRHAGGKDIARTSFVLRAVPPFLRQPLPPVLFAGEDLTAVIAVDGLDNDASYSWQLFEAARGGEVVKKDSGNGPVIRYHIPNNFTGKTLRIVGFYQGKPYRCIAPDSHAGSPLSFDIPVVEPPLQVAMSLPAAVPASFLFQFSAMRYSSARYLNDRPVANLQDLTILLTKENGTNIRLIPETISKGRFRFSIANQGLISRTGDQVILRISSGDDVYTRRFTVYRTKD
jgi:hypothetical protein